MNNNTDLEKKFNDCINRTNALIDLVSQALNIRNNREYIEVTKEDKTRAAYALNMCMVSVSQIVDYEDTNVLDQEYDAILNNLNLEKIPKDEALLHILRQLLDTITYFKIQEGDKKLIEKEYQHKLKNAIWNAVPNFGVLVAGTDPFTMGISLASQIGVGYMNYRRCKAENSIAFERQMWQLQRSAIEQFNALRRELFDTAWRLADTYNFEDNYRLTERQIKQYNEILMDSDEIRKYERLKSIEDKFEAYPPFWYFIGNTANYIAENIVKEDKAKKDFREKALAYFEKFTKLNDYNILREDQLAAACALEHAEILFLKGTKGKENHNSEIKKLLDTAVSMAGNSFDIIQICAIHYLRIQEIKSAEKYLRILVNEDYNKIINAQLLSRIYVSQKNSSDYALLERRVNAEYLFPMPKENEDEKSLETRFYDNQRELLIKKYRYLFEFFRSKAKVEVEKLTSISDRKEEFSDPIDKMQFNFKKSEILSPLKLGIFRTRLLRILNDFLNSYFELPFYKSDKAMSKLMVNAYLNEKEIDSINDLQSKIEDSNSFQYEDYIKIHNLNPLQIFSDDFIKILEDNIIKYISIGKIEDIQKKDTELIFYCNQKNIIMPDFSVDTSTNNISVDNNSDFLEYSIFGKKALFDQQVSQTLQKLREFVKSFYDSHRELVDGDDVIIWFEDGFKKYFDKNPGLPGFYKYWALMILEDNRKNREDLIIMPYSLYLIKSGKLKEINHGNSLKLNDKNEIIIKKNAFFDETYSNPSINNNMLIDLNDGIANKLKDMDGNQILWKMLQRNIYTN